MSEIVDSEFPSRIVPSTFGAIMRHKAVSLLPEFAAMDLSHRSPALPARTHLLQSIRPRNL